MSLPCLKSSSGLTFYLGYNPNSLHRLTSNPLHDMDMLLSNVNSQWSSELTMLQSHMTSSISWKANLVLSLGFFTFSSSLCQQYFSPKIVHSCHFLITQVLVRSPLKLLLEEQSTPLTQVIIPFSYLNLLQYNYIYLIFYFYVYFKSFLFFSLDQKVSSIWAAVFFSFKI